jgi:hypothetical protein
VQLSGDGAVPSIGIAIAPAITAMKARSFEFMLKRTSKLLPILSTNVMIATRVFASSWDRGQFIYFTHNSNTYSIFVYQGPFDSDPPNAVKYFKVMSMLH